MSDTERLLTPGEVARMFRVTPKTVARWANTGKITAVRTLGGHRRYRERDVLTLLAAGPSEVLTEQARQLWDDLRNMNGDNP